ncbi:AzlD domain-containing protein [Roseovarius sp. SCSIO 43702]|uniref:AzlD domain-containing protein n=1 Tax=Roseovarius sp. SCSIO 43702 TaxID=2823043 RepID=UPI001C73271B|nr:AzlD domain-containing protein [Roseovarius sp. SCSIO 43702]QYX55823.1 AzlD domain-containing protein [Roseovarius sp. SCSIO 43702]
MIDHVQLWIVILALGGGSYFFRFVFLGLIGNRSLPGWVLRHLRYTAVSVLPALIAPLVLWPPATGGEVDPARLVAAFAAVAVGLWTRNVIATIVTGGAVLYLGFYLAG